MKFTWKRFFVFVLLGILAGVANIVLIVLADKTDSWWEFYITLGVLGAFLGTIAGAMYIVENGLGRGRGTYVDDWGFVKSYAKVHTPRASGFALGFAVFHLLGPILAIVVMSFLQG
jgi:hypothetical protein